jgi:hypothetical protein
VSRRARTILIVVAAAAFVAVSALGARVLTVGNAERSAVLALVRAEARGDEAGVVARVRGCASAPGCRATVRRVIARVRAPGEVKILRLDGLHGVAIAGRSGRARIAWKAGTAFPVVQCFQLRTDGDALSGYTVRVASIADPIALDASC